MTFIRTVLASGAMVALLGTAAVAASSSPPPPQARSHSHEFKNSGLTRELKIMWHKEMRPELKAMPKEERKGWLRRKWDAMTAPQRRAKIAELQAKWNALPANVRQTLVERKMQKKEARQLRSGNEPQSRHHAPPPAQY
jgi:hypothetical protein